MKTSKRGFLPLAFAVLFLPPKKEMEDWSGALSTKDIPREAFQEKLPFVSMSSKPAPKTVDKKVFNSSPRFNFNGIDIVGFALNPGEKIQWEISLPPIDFTQVWESGAWSGVSLGAHELHHFYTRQQKRGPEPKYRAYTLASDWELIDLKLCSKRDSFLLEKASQTVNQEARYRVTRVKLLNSQELKRETSWQFTADTGQEFFSLKSEACSSIDLEGWPKSFRVKL